MAPYIGAVWASRFAMMASSSLLKHDRSEIGRYDLGCE